MSIEVPSGRFVAIDFETATSDHTSACAVAVVRVENARVVAQKVSLIRPPGPRPPDGRFQWTQTHDITWNDVKDAPTFKQVWPSFAPMFEGASWIIAHNASFDHSVLDKCCTAAGLPMPAGKWFCTCQMARKLWPKPRVLPSHKLDVCCTYHGIPLNHHEALSDALACADLYLHGQGKKLNREIAPRVQPAPTVEAPKPAPADTAIAEAPVAVAPKATAPESTAPGDQSPGRALWKHGRAVALGKAIEPQFEDSVSHGCFFGGFCAVRHEQEMERNAVLLKLTHDEHQKLLQAPALLDLSPDDVRTLLVAYVPPVTNDPPAAMAAEDPEVPHSLCGVCKFGALIDGGRRCLRCGWQRQEGVAA